MQEPGQTGPTALLMLHGTAVNQDGRSSSLTAPNGPAQQQTIREALQLASRVPQVSGSFSERCIRRRPSVCSILTAKAWPCSTDLNQDV